MFTKYIVVVDAGVDVHNTSEVLFHLTANTDPQRDSNFTKGPSDVLDHATSEIAMDQTGNRCHKENSRRRFQASVAAVDSHGRKRQKKVDALFGENRENEITCRAEAFAQAERWMMR